MYGPSNFAIEQINNSTGTVLYLHHDQQGSTRLLTGSTGKVEGKCSYGAYGTPTCEGITTTPLGFDGQYTSGDTGLIYMRARMYDPTTAQFLTADPLRAVTRAPFDFAGDNPVNERDRSGLAEESEVCFFPAGCVPFGGGPRGGSGGGIQEVLEQNGKEFDGGLERIGEKVGDIWNEITGGGGGSLPKREQEDGKLHGEIPSYPPSGATREELEEALEDLEGSMPIRQKQLEEKGEDKEHRKQLDAERKLRRQIEEKLGCGS